VTIYDPVTNEPTGSVAPFPGFTGTISVTSGDFNNDGIADIIAGAGLGGGPAIAILDSQTGQVIESFFAFDPAFTGGVNVAVYDVNNDGILDIIAAAGAGGGPEVRIFNGDGLTILRSFYAYAVDFSGGVSVATIDLNNDGILDIVTGAGAGGQVLLRGGDGGATGSGGDTTIFGGFGGSTGGFGGASSGGFGGSSMGGGSTFGAPAAGSFGGSTSGGFGSTAPATTGGFGSTPAPTFSTTPATTASGKPAGPAQSFPPM
jgi:hypothetical protein